jgi:molybdopterin-guanine dinucleotide biosynthesis protein
MDKVELTSRQMGKSSLMVRAAARLREHGLAVVIIDLTALGQHLTVEQWYNGPARHRRAPARSRGGAG